MTSWSLVFDVVLGRLLSLGSHFSVDWKGWCAKKVVDGGWEKVERKAS